MSKYVIFLIAQAIFLNEIQGCFLPPPALGCGLPTAPALSCLPPPPPCALPPPPACALPAAPALGCAPPPLILPMPLPAVPILPAPKLPLLLKKLLLPKLLGLSALGGCGLPPLGCAC